MIGWNGALGKLVEFQEFTPFTRLTACGRAYIPRFVPLQAEQVLKAPVVPIQDATQFGSGDSILFGSARRGIRCRRRQQGLQSTRKSRNRSVRGTDQRAYNPVVVVTFWVVVVKVSVNSFLATSYTR